MDPLPPPLAFFLLLFSGWINRQQQAVIDYLREENRILRAAYGPHRVRLTDDERRRLAVKGKALGRRRLADVAGIVTPDTILRWYRLLVAKKYDGSAKRRPGRPSTKPDLAALVARLATENPTWGYTRIRGGLQHLGHDVARNTIKAILKNHGIEPAPERGKKTGWKTFLAAHWDGLAAADFFTVEVLTWRGLVRYVVFFVMRLKTRTLEIAGISDQPDGDWMTQIARNLTDAHVGFLRDVQYIILDRDPLYTATFRDLLRDSGCPHLVAVSSWLPVFRVAAGRCTQFPRGTSRRFGAIRHRIVPNTHVEAVYADGVLKPTHELRRRDNQRVRLTVQAIDEPNRDREAVARLNSGIASMGFFSEGPFPSREELHDRG